MSIKFRQFKPPGVYLKDIRSYTGYADVKGACGKAGVVLWILKGKQYAPLEISQVIKVLKVIRSLQGEKFLKKVEKAQPPVQIPAHLPESSLPNQQTR